MASIFITGGAGEMLRVLCPGGSVIVLEFSKIWKPLQPLYDIYSFKALPFIGKFVAQDEESYRYLAESIRMHPSQEELKQLMQAVGFERVEYFNLSTGIVHFMVAINFSAGSAPYQSAFHPLHRKH